MSKRRKRMSRRAWWDKHNETIYSAFLGAALVVGLFIAFCLVRG